MQGRRATDLSVSPAGESRRVDILTRIVRTKQREVEALGARAGELKKEAARAPTPRDFEGALAGGGRISLIAEVKRRSPGAGAIDAALDPVDRALSYEAGGASALSVLTDADYFQGSLADLVEVRSAVGLPVLRKDFIIDELQVFEARAAGADAVLLIVRILDDGPLRYLRELAESLGMAVLVEAHDGHEVERALASGARILGINNRDLGTFHTDLAVTLGVMPAIPPGTVVVSESGIHESGQLEALGHAGIHAVLVGEALVRAPSARSLAGELAGVRRRLVSAAGHEGHRNRAPFVKICGLTSARDARMAREAGADLVGAVLVPESPRAVGAERAREIADAAGRPLVLVVADRGLEELVHLAAQSGAAALQLHGSESPEFVRRLRERTGLELWKAVRVRSREEFDSALEQWSVEVELILLDGWSARALGGTGTRFPWELLEARRDAVRPGTRIGVAGGLGPENVGDAVSRMSPDLVDVSSGVESRPGVKDPERLRAFIEAARSQH